MKKKIINGILMVALVAATSTSFVSCKDTNEDVQAEMQAEYADLLGRLKTLEGYDLDGRVTKLENKVKAHSEDIATLQDEIDALELWLVDAFSNLIYDVELSGSYNNMTGEIELPGVSPIMLFSNYGAAKVKGEFPANKDLLAEGLEPISWAAGDPIGQGSFEEGLPGTAGYLYANINRYIDLPLMTKDQWEASNDAKKSTYPYFDFSLIQSDGTVADGVVIANADATGATTDDVLNWGWTRYDNNVYKLGVAYTGTNAENYKFPTLKLQDLKDDIKAVLKNKNKQALGKLLADVYYNHLTKKSNLPKYALKIAWKDELAKAISDNANDAYVLDVTRDENGKITAVDTNEDGDIITISTTDKEEYGVEHKVISKHEILFATMQPLGFDQASAGTLAENAGKLTNDINKTFEKLESIENKIFDKIKAQLPNLSDDQIKTIIGDGTNLKKNADNTWHMIAPRAGVGGANIDIDVTSLIAPLNESLENVKSMFAQLNQLKEKLNGKTITNWVEKFTNKFNKTIENNAYQMLQPTLLALNDGTVNRVSGSKANPTPFAGEVILKPTSYTAEFLAPAYAKFVGCKDIKEPGFNEIIFVNDQELKFTPEKGKIYEIVYEAVDFIGTTFEHKYYIEGK